MLSPYGEWHLLQNARYTTAPASETAFLETGAGQVRVGEPAQQEIAEF